MYIFTSDLIQGFWQMLMSQKVKSVWFDIFNIFMNNSVELPAPSSSSLGIAMTQKKREKNPLSTTETLDSILD